MTIRQLPAAKAFERPQNFQADAPSDVLARWAANPMAAASEGENVISILDVIGEDWWTGGGFTAKRMSSALRAVGSQDVVVELNSPGGDMFEGIAIYNMLREHPHNVTVNVLGWAASAASIIAMAGDEINMGLGSFMMVHNAWGEVIGNRHDQRAAADMFDQFDGAIADIYEARTGMKHNAIVDLMDAETFMGPSEAVKNGFADAVKDGMDKRVAANNTAPDHALMARRRTEAALAKAGVTRAERKAMFDLFSGGARDAAPIPPRDAGETDAALARLLQTLNA